MKASILVTGGCGFIGSHLVDRLVQEGYKVKVYDVLEPQVHLGKKPEFLNKEAEYIFKDIRDKEELKKALRSVEVVFHFASQVGVGQSMYQIHKYVSHNIAGTGMLLDLVVNTKNKIKKIILASSMSIYGEGAYNCKICGNIFPKFRELTLLRKKIWEPRCLKCKNLLKSIPTSEDKPCFPSSIYALTKKVQEDMCLLIGKTYKIPVISLRFFNVYGPRQSLSNPYTGVAAIFLSRIKNSQPPLIYEDGFQMRDFIYVSDIVEAAILAMKAKNIDCDFFNVGTGQPHTILEIAKILISLYKKDLQPKILNKFRSGDIRHCYADISKINKKLGFKPKVSFMEGIKKLIAWSESQPCLDLTKKAEDELKRKGLL